jgi:hypothetical protein
MNLPALGAIGSTGAAPFADQPGTLGFAQLITALLAGSDVLGDEVAVSGEPFSTVAQEVVDEWTETGESTGDDTDQPVPWSTPLVHPSLVADALLRHLDRVGTPDFTPGLMGDAPPIAPDALSCPVVPIAVTPPPLAAHSTDPTPSFPVANPGEPTGAEPSLVESISTAGPAPGSSTDPEQGTTPVEPEPDPLRGDQPPATPPVAMAPQSTTAAASLTTPPVSVRPVSEPRLESAGPTKVGLGESTSDRFRGPAAFRPEATQPADGRNGIEQDQQPGEGDIEVGRGLKSRPDPGSQDHVEAIAPSDRIQRDADAVRSGIRPAEVLSAAARRVEEAVRQLEAAPPPSSVTMVIEELDLRLTVAIRPDGVHLSAPGPQAAMLVRSLEDALQSRGFDLSGRHRGHQEHQPSEAPVLRPAPRPTNRPAAGLRL